MKLLGVNSHELRACQAKNAQALLEGICNTESQNAMATHLCSGARLEARRSFLSDELKAELEAVVEHIGQPGKGISACDESGRTIDPRFKNVGVEPS